MKRYKLTFFVPKESANIVKDSIFESGAGKLGNYSHCSFETEGIGQFKPLSGAAPTIGTHNIIESVKELKVEILVLEQHMDNALKALKKSHPYEEIAFEVVKLEEQFTLD